MCAGSLSSNLQTSSGLQGDARFVLTTKGARILLSFKSASEELQPVLEEAKDFSPLSFKVAVPPSLSNKTPKNLPCQTTVNRAGRARS